MRWLAGATAAVIVVALAVMFLTVEVCEDHLATTGDDPGPVEVCRNLAVTDPPVVAVGVALLALVGVFYNEVSGFGITLKREVTEAKDAAATAREHASKARDAVTNLQSVLTVQMSSMQNELTQSVAATQRQISSIQANQSMVFSPTFNVAGAERTLPRDTETTLDQAAEPAQSNALERIRSQPAYGETGLTQVYETARNLPNRGVRVAILGMSPGIAVMGFPAFRRQIDQPYIGIGAEEYADHAIGAGELGHVLAMEPEAQVYPVIVTNRHGVTDVHGIRDGLVAALGWRPDVLLLGVAGGAGDADIDQLLQRASASTFVVVGAGNSGREGPEWPGSVPHVSSVASLDRTGQLAAFSNRGPGVDLAAPGVDVLSLVGIEESNQPVLGLLNGSSVSAALVAGLGAVLLARTEIEAQAVGQLLHSTARIEESSHIVDPPAALSTAASTEP